METPAPLLETARRLIHKGKKFDFEMVKVRGGGGAVIEREVVRHPGAVVIVPILREREGERSIVMIRNQRIALGGEELLECPAGTLEKGEDPGSCAARELIEETGYRAATVTPLGWFHTTPGMTDEKMFAFAAIGLTHIGQHLEEDESIRVEVMPAAGVLAAIDSGELRDGKSIIAVLKASRAGML